MLKQLKAEVRSLANKDSAAGAQRFFKTGKGEYGEGDLFLGIRAPVIKQIGKKYKDIAIDDVEILLSSKYNEERAMALFILSEKYSKAEKAEDNRAQKNIYDTYLRNFKYVNNWNLVDGSAPYITGRYLLNKDRRILTKWAKDSNMWVRRIAIVSNWWFIRKNDLSSVFEISELLLDDKHDLMHKATGWMLREAYKKDSKAVEEFLTKHIRKLPRTTLRYAIERMPETKRKEFLKK